jgi:hypothetical protein
VAQALEMVDTEDDAEELAPAPVVDAAPPAPAMPPAEIEAKEVAPPTPTPALAPAPAPAAAPPASQDPREWVRRFVGDAGPVQIGSKAMSGPGWASERSERLERFEPAAMPAARPAAPAKPRRAGVALGPPPRARRGHGGRALAVALLVAALLVVAIVLGWRAGLLAHRPEAREHLATTPAIATKPPAIASRPSASTPLVSTPAPLAPAPAPAAASAPDAAPIHGPYTIEVGSSTDLQEAYSQRDLAQNLTGIKGWVVPAPEGSGQPHRVIIGIYRQRSRADAAANMLLRSKTLGEATVVSLPRKSARF